MSKSHCTNRNRTKNVKTTPLQIANMMAAIARGGERKEVKIAEKVLYQNGTTMLSFQNKRPEGAALTAIQLKSCKNS